MEAEGEREDDERGGVGVGEVVEGGSYARIDEVAEHEEVGGEEEDGEEKPGEVEMGVEQQDSDEEDGVLGA